MTISISVGIQKGGVGKTTTTGIISYLLAQQGNKVLAVDLDPQSNLTQFLSGVEDPCDDFYQKTVLEGMLKEDASEFVVNVYNNLYLLPSNDFTASMPRILLQHFGKKAPLALKNSLSSIRDQFDYIILDLPPALSDQTINGLAESDYALVMFEPSKFCYNAIGRYLELIEEIKSRYKENLKPIGILRTLNDARRSDNKAFIELVDENYPELSFDTVILRKAATGRLPVTRFNDNSELKLAIEQYEIFLKELLDRVQKR